MNYVQQQIYSCAAIPFYDWMNYGYLTPSVPGGLKPTGPSCCHPRWSRGMRSGVKLEWDAVADADYYVLQWSRTEHFIGPTTRMEKVTEMVEKYGNYPVSVP